MDSITIAVTFSLKRNFLSDYVVRRFYKHSFLHRDILQVLNPLLFETHA